MFPNASILINETEDFLGLTAYLGRITGILDGGAVTNDLIQNDIILSDDAIGSIYLGGIAGMASGIILDVYVEGLIDAGSDHVYAGNPLINPDIHIGGIVGTHGEEMLDLYNAKNTADIQSFGTLDNLGATTAFNIYTGGVIGRITNTSDVIHHMGLITNTGAISTAEIVSSVAVTQLLGGVIGLYEGVPFSLNTRFGLFTNQGNLDINDKGSNTIIASNVLTSDFSAISEYIFLFNDGDFIANNMTNVTHTMLLLNLGEGLTLSQSRNTGDITLPDPINYSGVYLSPTNEPSYLRFVENSGDITLANETVSTPLDIAGITLSQNVEYLNIVASGDITLRNLSASAIIHVSGITKTLTSGYSIKNTLTEGTIHMAGINTSQNLYVGGFTNYNNSGDLDPSGNETRPKATIGILNSINDKDILSYLSPSAQDITGLGNTFAGGIVTFNDGSIQDTANTANIKIRNNSAINAAEVTFDPAQDYGGRVTRYRYGVITGGVTAAVLSGTSRIYDTTNSGEIIALSRNFARAGGILALALYVELQTGNAPTAASDTIFFSIVSNGINYGNVAAITEDIHIYSTDPLAFSHSLFIGGTTRNEVFTVTTTDGTQERPGVHASAGGVIGYGLSTMRRMINHGEVSSSDVAGGIVGATFVDTTIDVNIDTAINYGSVRAFDRNDFDNISADISYQTITPYFYATDDTFIYPVTFNDIRRYPESKRGIGGIFGRLQRGLNRYMRSTNGVFDFIVNMNPNVDLIGRLDQVANWSSSARFFVFVDSIYYSAKPNDTTQAVFTGFDFYYGATTATAPTRTTDTITTYTQYRYRYYSTGFWFWTRRYRQEQRYGIESGQIITEGDRYTEIGGTTSGPTYGVSVETLDGNEGWADFGNAVQVSSIPSPNPSDPIDFIPPIVVVTNSSSVTLTPGNYYFGQVLDVPLITEDPNDPDGDFVYDPAFEMRDENTITSTGDPITSYIYYIENPILADRFEIERPFGMYVLSTSSGSNFGAVIPANLDLTELYPLSGLLDYTTDYETTPLRIPVNSVVIDHYADLQQTKYNDRSKLLETDQDLRLTEDGGSETTLSNPVINFDNQTITFDLSLDTIIDLSPAQTTVTYDVTEAVLPFSAIIAIKYEDYIITNPGVTLDQFRQMLLADLGHVSSTTLAPDLFANLTPYLNIINPTTIPLGSFRSYSEVAANLTSFINPTYYTDYDVFLRLIPASAVVDSPRPDDYFVDGGGAVPFTQATPSIAETVDDSVRLTFDDPDGILPEGYDMTRFVSLYYGADLIDPLDYELIAEEMDDAGNMGFIVVLDPMMRGGTYEIRYQYYLAGDEHSITFNHRPNTGNQIISLSYPTYQDDPISGTTFVTYLDFGYELAFDTLAFTTNTDPVIPVYFDRDTYAVSILDTFVLSPYATLDNITYQGMTLNNGYRTFTVTYLVRSESGVAVTYTHQFVERPLDIVDVYKNQVRADQNDLFATREALSTVFSVDFGINEVLADAFYNLLTDDPTSYFSVFVTGVDFDLNPIIVDDITFGTDRYLNLIIGELTLPGTYTFTFTYTRGADVTVIADSVTITKLEGRSAYLSDIRFSLTATETDYPDLYVSDPVGNVISTTYITDVYINGIDYDNSEYDVFNYRVDGEVANTPLDNYTPYFLDYLPRGATIARKIYPLEDPLNDWTDEVDNSSSPAEQAVLSADFTLLPDTGIEPEEDEDVIITYRVTSEDGQTIVYYHITVVDIIYNVSVIFEILYLDPVDGLLDAKDSELLHKPLLINVKNFNTDIPVTNIVYPTVDDFPVFQTITSLNNSVSMFYVANNNNYNYRFGRNLSGFFAYTFDLPKDPDGNDYTYAIFYNGDPLDEVSDYATGLDGYYFYINGGTKNRTRRFTVVIQRTGTTFDSGWGLDDNQSTWKD
ncbi:MAG: hypothetical protein K9K93_07090 [Acholeplasmataceae bacterium]|nr:hypothetical protein [Acholeplasmataceae bacterium]